MRFVPSIRVEWAAVSNASRRRRVLIDTNVYVSALLERRFTTGNLGDLIRLALAGEISIILPQEVTAELRDVISRKPYLQKNIPVDLMETMVAQLAAIADAGVPLIGTPASIVRDRHDDYLMAYALAYDVDVLISEDKDLLELREQFDRPRIVTVRAFLDELHTLQ